MMLESKRTWRLNAKSTTAVRIIELDDVRMKHEPIDFG